MNWRHIFLLFASILAFCAAQPAGRSQEVSFGLVDSPELHNLIAVKVPFIFKKMSLQFLVSFLDDWTHERNTTVALSALPQIRPRQKMQKLSSWFKELKDSKKNW